MEQVVTPEETVLLRAFLKAIEEYGVKSPIALGLPSNIPVVEWEKVIHAYEHLTFDAVGDSGESPTARKKRLDARRKELKRIGELLCQKELIAKAGKVVWLTGKPWLSEKPEAQIVSLTLPQLSRIENLLLEIVARLDRLERPSVRSAKMAPRASEEFKKQAARFYALSKEAEKAEVADDFEF